MNQNWSGHDERWRASDCDSERNAVVVKKTDIENQLREAKLGMAGSYDMTNEILFGILDDVLAELRAIRVLLERLRTMDDQHFNSAGEPVTREQWLAGRRLGSSDAPAICGMSPWKSPYAVWAERVGLLPPVEENEPMWWGKALESIIAERFSLTTGMEIARLQRNFVHPSNDFMTATPDYAVADASEDVGILEIKNANHYANKNWEGGLPEPVHVQIMHQLACCPDMKFGIGAACVGGNKLVWHRIERDEEAIAAIESIERGFWQMVLDRRPPPMEAGDNDVMGILYGKNHAIGTIDLPAEAERWIRQYDEARTIEKNAKERKNAAAAELKAILGNAETGVLGGSRVTWKNSQKKAHTVSAWSGRVLNVKATSGDTFNGDD